MDQAVRQEIDAIRADRSSGATALLVRGVALLRRAASDPDLAAIAEALCQAQPSMAGFRTAARIVASAADPVAALAVFATRVDRAADVMARYGAELLALERAEVIRVVTVSRSAAVAAALIRLHAIREIVVCCAESRPALEGRDLAADLGARGLRVELYTDAGVSAAVPGAHAVLCGADAVGPGSFLNKVGTRAVCSLASSCGVPAYVLAGREKFVSATEFDRLPMTEGAPAEVLPVMSRGVLVRNPYFEPIPLELMGGLVTDAGVVAPEAAVNVYESYTII